MKLFRREAGPGSQDRELEMLRGEVARLGAVIGADPRNLVGFEHQDGAAPFIVIDADGVYHWMVVERGQVLQDRATTARDDVLYWSFQATTFSMAADWAARHPVEGQEFRVTLWAQQFAWLRALDPRWEQRRRQDLTDEVEDLPPLPA